MIAAAGKLGIEIVKKLKFGKSYIGKQSKKGVTYLGNRGYAKSAKALDVAATKGNVAINWSAKKAKEYPRIASAIGGAAAWDFLDND